MLKLGRRARGHFVTLIEIRVHLIRVKPGHISGNDYRLNLARNKSDLYPLWQLCPLLVSARKTQLN